MSLPCRPPQRNVALRPRGPGLMRGGVLAAALLCLVPLSSSPVAAQDDDQPGTSLVLDLVDDPALDDMGAFAGLTHVAAGDGMLVVLAECEEGDCTLVARSDDDERWEHLPGNLADYPRDLVWSGDAFVALTVDGGGRRFSAYRSPDGHAWQRSRLGDLGPQPSLVAGPGGPLVLGCEGAGCYLDLYGTGGRQKRAVSTVWTSTDGSTWTREAPAVLQGTVLTDAASSRGAVVAIGRPVDAAEADTAFLSMDGTWLPLDLPLSELQGGGIVGLIDVAGLPGGGFAITGEVLPDASEPLGDPFLLTSTDGLAWELDERFLDAEVPDVQVYAQSPAEGADGLVASMALELDLRRPRSAVDSPVLAWSSDGRRWATTTIPRPRATRANVSDMAITQDGAVVLVGSLAGRAAERTAMWTATPGPGGDTPDDGGVDGPDPSVRPSTAFTLAELVLLEAVLPDIVTSCVPRREALPDGTVAAVQCKPDSPVVRDMAYYLLEGDDARAVFDERMREHRVTAASTMRCRRGRPAYEYATGALEADGCYVDEDGRANLRSISWVTDCRVLPAGGALLEEPTLYVAVLGEDEDIASLWEWAARGTWVRIERPDAAFSPACPS